jgi:hypothetical protein
MMVPVRHILRDLQRKAFEALYLLDRRGVIDVVQVRIHVGKPFSADMFFIVEVSLFVAKLNVPLLGNSPALDVE